MRNERVRVQERPADWSPTGRCQIRLSKIQIFMGEFGTGNMQLARTWWNALFSLKRPLPTAGQRCNRCASRRWRVHTYLWLMLCDYCARREPESLMFRALAGAAWTESVDLGREGINAVARMPAEVEQETAIYIGCGAAQMHSTWCKNRLSRLQHHKRRITVWFSPLPPLFPKLVNLAWSSQFWLWKD